MINIKTILDIPYQINLIRIDYTFEKGLDSFLFYPLEKRMVVFLHDRLLFKFLWYMLINSLSSIKTLSEFDTQYKWDSPRSLLNHSTSF